MEQWKDIPGYEGLYQVSDLGRVKSLYNNIILKPRTAGNGYFAVGLYKNKQQRQFIVHRLVWTVFNGPIPENMQINHINEDKTDNRLANLNTMSAKENINWGTRNDRASQTMTNGKLSKKVEQYDLDGNLLAVFPSASEAGRTIKKLTCNITACCRGQIKTAYGFIWQYAV